MLLRSLTPVRLAALAVLLAPAAAAAQDFPGSEKKYEDFDKVVKGAKEYDGLFRLHHKEDRLYAELKPNQLNHPYLCPIAIARGMGMGGHTLNFDGQWVLLFKRIGDRVHVVRRNVRFKAKPGSPQSTAVETSYADSVLTALKVLAVHPSRQSVLVNLNELFMTDFAQLNLGFFDASRSSWHKVKAFPRNVEVEVAATYAGRGSRSDSVIDGRGTTVIVHYGLCELPDGGYQPRLADDRVGHFLSVAKDFSSDSHDTAFLRYVNRWRVERAEPVDAKRPGRLSPPKKKIVYWIEKSVPVEYRTYVREGILEWNRAFEKVGFRDVIEVRQQEGEDFDPEDTNYNTFRWITNDEGYAMGPSRANPLTGEIFDADIVFDASMVRFWKQEHQLRAGGAEPASLIEAGRRGWGLSLPFPLEQARSASEGIPSLALRAGAEGPQQGGGWNDRPTAAREGGKFDPRLLAVRYGACQCAAHRKAELGMASLALMTRGLLKEGEKVPEELIGQAVRETTMHEVGHTLGLRHNFKASTMLKNDQLHDVALTRKQGLVGSVMDYAPVNLAPKGVKQGDYFSTTLGPYDYWAIEYAYRPLAGDTEAELEKLQEIAKKGASPGHDYGTDEDLFTTSDPLINQWDLGSDPLQFARERVALAEELLRGLEERVVDKGEGYQRLRAAFGLLLGQYGNAAHLAANHVGGEYAHRDHRGDPSGRDPFVPVKADKQREGLKFLQETILTDRPFRFSPALLRRLAADRWSHWGNDQMIFRPVDYPVHERILAIQRVVLGHVFSPQVLARIQNTALKVDKGERPLTLEELFRAVTDSVWPAAGTKDGKKTLESSVIVRNLQREHLKEMSVLVLGQRGAPPDARSLARFHLRGVDRQLKQLLVDKGVGVDDTTRAHLEECQERIAKVLGASMQLTQP